MSEIVLILLGVDLFICNSFVSGYMPVKLVFPRSQIPKMSYLTLLYSILGMLSTVFSILEMFAYFFHFATYSSISPCMPVMSSGESKTSVKFEFPEV